MDPHEILAMADERFERRLMQESSAIRQEMAVGRQETAAVRQEMNALRRDMIEGFAQIHQKIADARADVITWSFLFGPAKSLTTAGILLAILRSR